MRETRYSAAYNATTNTPKDASSTPAVDGGGYGLALPSPLGRVYLELLSVTTAGGSGALSVRLLLRGRGLRAYVETADATAIVTGSARLWSYDERAARWHLTPIEEALPLAARVMVGDWEVLP